MNANVIRATLATACLLVGCATTQTTQPSLDTAIAGMSYPTTTYPSPTSTPTYQPTPTYTPTYAPTPTYTPSPVYTPSAKPSEKVQDCCKVTGGGFIKLKGYKGDDVKVNFGFNAQFGPDGRPKGNVNVVAHFDENEHFKSDGVSNIECVLNAGSAHPRLTGTVTVTGTLKSNETFVLVVVDNGEPGSDDHFEFRTSGGFTASGTLQGGNIQIHRDDCD